MDVVRAVVFLVGGDCEQSAIAGESRIAIAGSGQFFQFFTGTVKPCEPGDAFSCRLEDDHTVVRNRESGTGEGRALFQFLSPHNPRPTRKPHYFALQPPLHSTAISDLS